MQNSALAWSAPRVIAALLALGVMVVTPAIIATPNGTTGDPAGIAIDAVALAVLVAVAWSALRARRHG